MRVVLLFAQSLEEETVQRIVSLSACHHFFPPEEEMEVRHNTRSQPTVTLGPLCMLEDFTGEFGEGLPGASGLASLNLSFLT